MRRSTVLLLAGLAAVTCLILAGCGGGSSSTTDTTATQPDNTQKSQAPHAPAHFPKMGKTHYKNSCAEGICPDVKALDGWKQGPKPKGNPKFVVQLKTFVHSVGPNCQYVFQLSPPLKNPPTPDKLAASLNPAPAKKGGKKLPPPPQYKKMAASVYVQPLVVNTVMPITPLYQSGVKYVKKDGTSYAIMGSINLGTPSGGTKMCSKAEITSAKKQITKNLIAYLRATGV